MLLQSPQLLMVLVLLSVATASYPFKPIKRIDELKIPFCIDQVGYKCLTCGYDDEKKVYTAPNVWGTACLPSVNGCLKYKDLKGEVCDGSNGCGCGFVKNHLADCIPVPPGLENCFELTRGGTKCKTCVNPSLAKYGGGQGDYGRSFDMSQCLDNTALNKPNCEVYKTGDTDCAKCRVGYAFNAAGVCIKLRNINEENCQLASDAGLCIKCQLNAEWNGTGCNVTDRSLNCRTFFQLPNGLDDQSTCVQCEPGYIITVSGCRILPAEGSATPLDRASLTTTVEQILGRWCLGTIQTYLSKEACVIPIANRALYTKGTTVASVETYSDSNCRKDRVNFDDLSCPTAGDCYAGNSATIWESNTKRCIIHGSVSGCLHLNYCQISDTYAQCTTCYDGYQPDALGICQKISSIDGCKELNADGLTCKTCYTNFVGVNTVNNQKVWKYYKLNKVTGKCVEQLTLVANCITYDDNWLCTKCNDGYDVKEGECALKTPLETPLGQYGCKTFDGSKCTQALPGFECDAIGYSCWVKNTKHNCLSFKTDGDCDYCVSQEYFKVYDDVTKKFSRCAQNSSRNDDIGCAQRETSCGDCLECKPTFSKTTRTISSLDNGCYRSATDTGAATIEGCVVYSSADACTTCGFGFIKTTDNKCFDLYGRRYDGNNEPGYLSKAVVNNDLSNLIPEPCKTASTKTICTACQAPAGADIGLRKFAVAFFPDVGSVAAAFCVYNQENLSIFPSSSGSKVAMTEFLNCATYQESTLASTVVNECEAAATGYTISNGVITNSALSTGTEFGMTANSCKGAITYNASNAPPRWECSDCNPGFTLNASKTCVAVSGQVGANGCAQGTINATDGQFTCSNCRAGYQLNIDPNTTNKNWSDQCHEIAAYDNSPCGTNFKCANQDLTITWTAALSGTNTVARVVSSCLAGFELKNSLRCVPTTTVIPNCAKFLDTGVCQSCNAGFVLVDTTESDDAQNLTSDSLDRSDLLIYRCIPVVTGCTNYDGTTQKCKQCNQDNATGKWLVPDASGNVCLDESTFISTGCAQFQRDSQTVCLKCKPGRGVPTDGCLLPAPICIGWEPDYPDVCNSCPTDTYKLNYKRECVPNVLRLLDNCDTAYNSTTCLSCASGFVKVTNEDNDEAQDIGVCQSSDQISNCVHVSADGTQCYRCDTGYAWLDGACIANPPAADDPLRNCAQYKYDTDKKQLYCSECLYGYAIDGNYTTCILNTHNCSDVSGGNDCSLIKALVPYGQTFECDSYRSSSVLISFSMILALIFYIFL